MSGESKKMVLMVISSISMGISLISYFNGQRDITLASLTIAIVLALISTIISRKE